MLIVSQSDEPTENDNNSKSQNTSQQQQMAQETGKYTYNAPPAPSHFPARKNNAKQHNTHTHTYTLKARQNHPSIDERTVQCRHASYATFFSRAVGNIYIYM